MAKIKSFGAKVYVNGVAIGGLTDINASGTDVTMVDNTSHDSSGGYREFLAGLKDGGTLELTGRYNYADAGQADLKSEEGVTHAVYVILSDNSGLAFNAIIGGFSTSNPLDDAVEFTASAKITGAVLPVFPTITVTGTLTSDGSTAVTFPAMSFAGISTGLLSYINGAYEVQNDGTNYYVWDGVSAQWTASTTSIVPQGLTYVADDTETGTPVLTGS